MRVTSAQIGGFGNPERGSRGSRILVPDNVKKFLVDSDRFRVSAELEEAFRTIIECLVGTIILRVLFQECLVNN